MQMTFFEMTELTERSLRRFASNKGVTLQKSGPDYTIIRDGAPMVTVDDEDCWAILASL